MPKTQPQLPLVLSEPKRRPDPVASMADSEAGRAKTGRKPRGWVKRFWESVQKGKPDECWKWKGYINTNGYGSMWITTGKRDAHRLSFLLAHGSINPALFVMHSCDNRWCVNPAHLSQGTIVDNYRDAVQKRRHCYGERNGESVLTETQVRTIRSRFASGRETTRSLAKEYGVHETCVRGIVKRKTWRHLL